MPDSTISPAAIVKGKSLEVVIDRFLKKLKIQLSSYGITSLYRKSKTYPGQAKSNIDFLFLIRSKNRHLYWIYIEAKNYMDSPRSFQDVQTRILKKFGSLNWESYEQSEKKMGIIVGHFKMSKRSIKRLSAIGIHYLDTGEIGYRATTDDIFAYGVFLRVRLLQYMAIHTKNIFESLPDKYRLEIVNENRFLIKRNDGSTVSYDVDEIREVGHVPVDYPNLMNSFTIEKGKKGSVTVVSPWKGYTKNPQISVRIKRKGTTLFETKWGISRR